MSAWHKIDEEPIPDTVVDVVAKYYDARRDMFLFARFAGCVMIDDEVLWPNPFDKFQAREVSTPIRLTDHGFGPTHWMIVPEGPPELVRDAG